MASTVKHLRSSTANKRPTASGLADGQLGINTASGTPGVFFKDSAGTVTKVGPAHVGSTAPNVSPAGSAGNSRGELWVNNSTTINGLNYYTGSAFVNLTPSGTTTVAGLVELATDAETQTGTDIVRAVTPSGLQSKISNSTSTTSSTTIASATAVKAAYDLADAALPKTGGRVTGNLEIGPAGSLSFEGSSDDSFGTTVTVVNPTANRTFTLPNITGTGITTGDTGTVTSTMILNDTILNDDINASAAIADTKLATISTAGKVNGSAITSGGINTSGNLEITNTAPAIRLTESGGTATHSQSFLARDNDAFLIQTRDSASTFLSTDYFIPANASGATDHIWRIANTEKVRIDSNGKLLVGTPTSRAIFNNSTSTAALQVEGANEGTSGLSITRTSADVQPSRLYLAKSRGSVGGTPTIVIDGDDLGNISFQGADGTEFVQAANIIGEVDGTPGANDMPGRLIFSTTADGSASPTERLRIDNQGRMGFNSTALGGVNGAYRFAGNITGAASSNGLIYTPTVQSDATTLASLVRAQPSTSSNGGTPYTIATIQCFAASQSTFNADSTVTTQIGFEAVGSLTGATNNYGFFGNLASATGRWNFYANNTAPNYFNGDVRTNTVFTARAVPSNSNVTATATASSLKDGLRTGTPTGNIDLTIPTGTDMDSTFQDLQNNQSFEWSVINLAASSHVITVVAASGHTVVGNMAVAANSSGRFITRKTAANTFISYRIA